MALDFTRPQVMGILNITPDSFSDGGVFMSLEAARAQARAMVAEGATLIDVGGESTRPGAQAITVQAEMDRVLPVIEALAEELPVILSIDTYKPEVMRAAVAVGARFINDVCALQQPGALAAVAELAVPVCVMHKQGEPDSMQTAPHYVDVVGEVSDFLQQRVAACVSAGIAREHIVIDPGLGFGKTADHNLKLLQSLEQFTGLGCPVLIGASRKTFIGKILDAPVTARLHGSVAVAVWALTQGARLLRVHDVRATVEAVRIVEAIRQA